MTEAMIAAGISQGLAPEIARKLAVHTVFGAGILMAQTGEEPAELRKKVTSPGGTTEAALKVFQDRQFAEIVAAAMQASEQRGRQLAGN
jgi:pyrroline-5-carboxylate reductase